MVLNPHALESELEAAVLTGIFFLAVTVYIHWIQAQKIMHTFLLLFNSKTLENSASTSLLSLLDSMNSPSASRKLSSGKFWAVILLWSVGGFQTWSLQMKNIRQSGQQPKCSLSSVFISPCKFRNLVAKRCQMANLRCRTILPALTLVSQ